MRALAFKEWAVIVRALLEGEQIIDVRKGGLHEHGRHFGVRAPRVWLYPTAEHQRPDLLKGAYRHTIDLSTASPVGEPIPIEGWADVVGVATVADPDHLAEIDSKTIWTHAYAESRLKWKRRDPLWVLALRAFRLADPITVPWRDEYGGCTSWVDLTDLPDDPAALPSEPALSDVAFKSRLAGVAGELPVGFDKAPAAS
ncbi:MAG: DUF1802 family protein [Ilumatobacteraceae bacterium]